MKSVIVAWIFILVTTANAKTISFESGENRVNLIELYSSEGCSSCPPADRWLSNLRNHPQLFKNFVPIEFHVDYWNRLGWIDPFSHKQFTDRQRFIAHEWGTNRVYTPGFVMNGNEWRVNQAIPSNNKKVGNLKVQKKWQPYNCSVYSHQQTTTKLPSVCRCIRKRPRD